MNSVRTTRELCGQKRTTRETERESGLVSVVIPTHDRPAMLSRAIKSVLSQSYPELELIVVSDGRFGETDSMVESFDDGRISYVRHERSLGASAARNTGIERARGEYIAFLDDDDEWVADKLKAQVELLANSSADVGLVYGWMEYVRDGAVVGRRQPQLRGDIFEEMLCKQAITNSSTLLVKRDVIDSVGGFDEALPRGNDGNFIRRISQCFYVDFVPQTVARVHVGHPDRITCKTVSNLRDATRALERRLRIFSDVFDNRPEEKLVNLEKIIANGITTGEWRRACGYLVSLHALDVPYTRKARSLFRIAKASILKAERVARNKVLRHWE